MQESSDADQCPAAHIAGSLTRDQWLPLNRYVPLRSSLRDLPPSTRALYRWWYATIIETAGTLLRISGAMLVAQEAGSSYAVWRSLSQLPLLSHASSLRFTHTHASQAQRHCKQPHKSALFRTYH